MRCHLTSVAQEQKAKEDARGTNPIAHTPANLNIDQLLDKMIVR